MSDIDELDWPALLQKILFQGVDDYCKLYHPKYRDKKYLYEAFVHAVDMIFDPEFRLKHLQNEDAEDMGLVELLKVATKTKKIDISKFQEYVANQTSEYWKEKEIETLTIPEIICVSGYVYDVHHNPDESYVDYDEYNIYLDKTQTCANEEIFLKLMFELVCYHSDTAMPKRRRDELATNFFQLLKVNNCFR